MPYPPCLACLPACPPARLPCLPACACSHAQVQAPKIRAYPRAGPSKAHEACAQLQKRHCCAQLWVCGGIHSTQQILWPCAPLRCCLFAACCCFVLPAWMGHVVHPTCFRRHWCRCQCPPALLALVRGQHRDWNNLPGSGHHVACTCPLLAVCRLHFVKPADEKKPMWHTNLWQSLAIVADWRQQHLEQLPAFIWMDTPVQARRGMHSN